MRLAMRLPPKKGENGSADGGDPREETSAEIIDLASRSTFPQVTERKTSTDGLGLALGAVVVLGLGAVTWWSMNASQIDPADQSDGAQVAEAQTPVQPPADSPTRTGAPAPAPAPQRPDPAPAPVLARAPDSNPATNSNPYASPTLTYDASAAANRSASAPPTPASPAGTAASPSGGLSGSAAAFAASIGGVGGGPAIATPIANPSTTVTKGTLIPAILETAINTDVPGYVRATVSQEVRSFDGKTVLVPRSSRLIGQYQSGVQQGQKRAYVIWEDLIRPDGVRVKISSPAVAFDGTTGLAGEVDNHFFSRFGSGLLLSVVGGLGAVATGGVGGVILAGGAQSAASSAVQQDGQRSPTIRVKPGEPIRVFTARDLDFSTVAN